jgi:hypothetical protein
MDFSDLPTDHFAKADQFTRDLYYDVYPSIDPSSELLSQNGKIILVTGASSGIGRHVSSHDIFTVALLLTTRPHRELPCLSPRQAQVSLYLRDETSMI